MLPESLLPGGKKMNIYMCGCLGYETAEKLFYDNEKFLTEYFAEFYLQRFKRLKKELVLTVPTGYFYVKEIKHGGLFGALWEAAEDLGCGLCVRTDEIPLRQEIVEIMELFNEDPYESSSAGSFIIFDYGENTGGPEHLKKIGETNNKKSRVVIAPSGTRFLTPAKRQDKDIAVRSAGKQGKQLWK